MFPLYCFPTDVMDLPDPTFNTNCSTYTLQSFSEIIPENNNTFNIKWKDPLVLGGIRLDTSLCDDKWDLIDANVTVSYVDASDITSQLLLYSEVGLMRTSAAKVI